MCFHHHTRVWALDGGTEAIAATLVLLLLIDDILVVLWIKETVLIVMIVYTDESLSLGGLALLAKKVRR
jgi:hypothetical protein